MIFLKRLEGHHQIDKHIETVNSIRSSYPYSQKSYELGQIEDVYLIESPAGFCGFCEIKFTNTDFIAPKPTIIYLAELHIDGNQQNKGLGAQVISHLQAFNVPIEMVVARENKPMIRMLTKFDATKLQDYGDTHRYLIGIGT